MNKSPKESKESQKNKTDKGNGSRRKNWIINSKENKNQGNFGSGTSGEVNRNYRHKHHQQNISNGRQNLRI